MDEPSRTEDRLTDRRFWDDYWAGTRLPQEARKGQGRHYVEEILRVFDRHLPRDPGLSALEVGGAPGQYLAYLRRQFGYDCAALDYSEPGCAKTRKNFDLLGLPVRVHHADLFAPDLDLPRFDIVFSLGLIEHFVDLEQVVARHLALTKPGGRLVVGCPNLRGVNRLLLERLAPAKLSLHQLSTMDLSRWGEWERRLGVRVLFRGYVGGFEPGVFDVCESPTPANRVLKSVAHALHLLLRDRFRFQRRFNSRWTSGYLMGVYEAPPGG